MNNVLMVAYHYPPVGYSSGVHRTLAFSKYLSGFGWQPIVLTVTPGAYECANESQLGDIPDDLIVKRAFALDAARHLSIGGRYLGWTALPDRWVSWLPFAVMNGLLLIKKHKPKVIWSTYPIASAHLVGYCLSKLTGIPWVADFRDSMTEPGFPEDKSKWRLYRRIEKTAVENSSVSVFTTLGASAMYQDRYAYMGSDRFSVIENGYDEEAFSRAEQMPPLSFLGGDKIRLLHSGTLYPSERDPLPFFNAIAFLKRTGKFAGFRLEVILRATGHDDVYRTLISELGIDGIVKIRPPLPYHEALREMLDVDGLLVFQASNCNHQIPAKVYEYIRAQRPVFTLSDHAGDTVRLLKKLGYTDICGLNSEGQIVDSLMSFIEKVRNKGFLLPDGGKIAEISRFARTRELAGLFDRLY